jgi:hypothetical protein
MNSEWLQKKNFDNLNESLSEEEFKKMIAETVWMADRPRTWWEWICSFWSVV